MVTKTSFSYSCSVPASTVVQLRFSGFLQKLINKGFFYGQRNQPSTVNLPLGEGWSGHEGQGATEGPGLWVVTQGIR